MAEAIDPKVKGIEKYRLSLNVIKTKTPKIIPAVIRIIPGIPKYFKGCLIAINSIKEAITSALWDIGLFVDVFVPVL